MDRKVVLVLTPGRSGSSVFTQILSVLGLRLSGNLISATEANPQGYFEDADIVQREKELLQSLGIPPQLPLPPSSLSSREAGNYVSFLKEYLEQQVNLDGTWLCKVPTLCSTLPLWQKAMQQSRIVPFYFLAVRNLNSTLASFLKVGSSKEGAEQTIFTRTVNVLQQVQSNLFIQHYEHLFDNFDRVAREIGTWLSLPINQERIDQARQCLIPHLNRAQYQIVSPDNPLLVQLYDYLSTCAGFNYDKAPLQQYISSMKPAFDLGETAADRLFVYHKKNMAQQDKERIQNQKEKETLIKSHTRELQRYKQEHDAALQAAVKKYETEISTLCSLNASQENKLYALSQEVQNLLKKNHSLQQKLQANQGTVKEPAASSARTRKQDKSILSRKERLARKLRHHPYEFFRDSKNPFVRSLRIFFLLKRDK